MDFKIILSAAVVIGGMGLVFGAVLAIVSRIFHVEEDPRIAQVRNCLPGANCGGCGYAGCDAYAQAVVMDNADVNSCAVAGNAGAEAIGAIMGRSVLTREEKVAIVKCRGDLEKCGIRFDYNGIKTCRAANIAANGDKACQFSCLGFGDCVSVCKFGAMKFKEGRLVEVDPEKCTGCGTCVDICPRSVIQLVPKNHVVHGVCSAMDRGRVVREYCVAGCISCGKCERMCKFGALKMKDNLPNIDMSLCVGCMQCADNCPTGSLKANEKLRKHAIIHYNDCIGCGDCTNVCQFNAIAGAPGEKHSIIEWNCVGCSRCSYACPNDCIEMVTGGVFKKR